MRKEVLGIIPARGGSKGIPQKNIKVLLGKPLIVWSIEEALRSRLLTRVIVSTDDEQIAEIAKAAGAEVPFLRPQELAQDFSIDVEFILHALDWLKDNEGYEPEIVLRLPPTSPLRTAKHIDEGIKRLLAIPQADAVRPICKVAKHPYKFWKISENDSKFIEPFLDSSITGFEDAANLPRQLFPDVYMHTGAMDVIRTKTVREQRSTSGRFLAYFLMPPECAVNIDEPLDFEFAELLLRTSRNKSATKA